MSVVLSFSVFIRRLGLKDLFTRPVKLIIGRWFLFEYYTEPGNELINIKQDDLKRDNNYWELDFRKGGILIQTSNLPVRFIEDAEFVRWNMSGNFLKVIHPCDLHRYVVFQFAIDKDCLKLLKKDNSGKIVFFGFFRKVTPCVTSA